MTAGRLGMIWAQDRARGIGRDGDLPWHLPEDMAHFRETTRGRPVIMGRLQWESLPERFRPLPGRENVVLTRNPGYEAPGALVVTDLDVALEHVRGQDAWVVGGGQVYELAMPHADVLVVTTIDTLTEADTFAPEIDEDEWRAVHREPARGWTTAANGMRFAITRYERAGA
jgi:dihydrofolate reductase